MQRERRVVARGEDEPQTRGRGAQQLLHRRADLRAADAVEVVDDHDERLLELGEAVQQLDDERRRRAAARPGEPPQARARRRNAMDGGEPLRPESRFGQLRARCEPRDLTRVCGEPRGEQ